MGILSRIKHREDKEEHPKDILKLLTFTPQENLERNIDYASQLENLTLENDIRNIAIIGDYGTGKSSIINKYINKGSIRKQKPKIISFLTLQSQRARRKNASEKKKSEPISYKIQSEIVKQLFYGEKADLLRESGFKRIDKPSSFLALIVVTLLAVFLCSKFSDIYDWFINTLLVKSGFLLNLDNSIILLAYIILFLTISLLLIRPIYRIIRHITSLKIKHVSLPDISIDFDDGKPNFQQNADFLIYYFRKTKRRILIFEDLDRFDDEYIFEDLRQLNLLINSTPEIKKKVTFVYTTKSQIFKSPQGKAKIFDAIIPILPFISSNNTGCYTEDLLKGYNLDKTIAKEILSTITHKVVDMRTLKAAINRFVLLCKTFNVNDGDEIGIKNCASIALAAELFPEEYLKLTVNTSELDSRLSDGEEKKGEAINNAKDTNTVSHLLKTNKEKIWDELRNMKGISLDDNRIQELTVDGVKYVIKSDEATLLLINAKEIEIKERENYSLRIHTFDASEIKTIINKVAPLALKPKELKTKQNRAISEESRKDPLQYTLKDICAPKRNISTENELKPKEFFDILIRNNYITEQYKDYITEYPNNSDDIKAANFIANNIRLDNLSIEANYAFPTKTFAKQIISRLTDSDYNLRGIFNRDLIIEMLSFSNSEDERNKNLNRIIEAGEKNKTEFATFLARFLIENYIQILEQVNRKHILAIEIFRNLLDEHVDIALSVIAKLKVENPELARLLFEKVLEREKTISYAILQENGIAQIGELIGVLNAPVSINNALSLYRESQEEIGDINSFPNDTFTIDNINNYKILLSINNMHNLDPEALLAYIKSHEASYGVLEDALRYIPTNPEQTKQLLDKLMTATGQPYKDIAELAVDKSRSIGFDLKIDTFNTLKPFIAPDKAKDYISKSSYDKKEAKLAILGINNDEFNKLSDPEAKILYISRTSVNSKLALKLQKVGLVKIENYKTKNQIRLRILRPE